MSYVLNSYLLTYLLTDELGCTEGDMENTLFI